MLVRMRIQISGTRNDERWPPAGALLDVPAAEAADLIRAELAYPAPELVPAVPEPVPAVPEPVPAVPEPVPAVPEAAETAEPPGELPRLAPDAADADGAGSGGDDAAVQDAAEPDGTAAAAPGPSAPKQAWIDYAVRVQGADVHAASNMTKADLMSRYGGRL
jgi:hypothetical protein